MTIGIYKITSMATGKIYVGQSISVESRSGSHFGTLKLGKHPNKALQKDFNKYGPDLFVLELIEETPAEALNEREQFWTTQFHQLPGGCYNRKNITPKARRNSQPTVPLQVTRSQRQWLNEIVAAMMMKGRRISHSEVIECVKGLLPVEQLIECLTKPNP